MTATPIMLYDATNIDTIAWPSSEDGQRLKNYLAPLVKNGSRHYVENINAQIYLLKAKDQYLPVTVTDTQYDNSFVCSPYSHYISYGFIFIDTIKNRFLSGLGKFVLKGLASLMRKGKINKVVIVNNWLFTTNPHPPIDKETMEEIVRTISHHFPDHAIVFRSITRETATICYDALKSNRFDMIASRYVYLSNGKDDSIFNTRIFKSDLKLLRESPYTILEGQQISEEDVPKIQELYNSLYIQKYSSLNPQFNQNFIRHALHTQILNLKVIKNQDTIEGVAGYLCNNGVMISPFFGYHPGPSESKGVYRILSTLLMLEAKNRHLLFNQSAGGSFYKKIRRADGHMEYTAVYSRHLSWKRRFPWKILQLLLNSFGKYSMKKY